MFENCNSSLGDLLDFEIRIDRPSKPSPKLEKRRKFPGPAGLLPENLEDESLLLENSFLEENDEEEEEIKEANEILFLGSAWKEMTQEFGEFINKLNINYIKTNLQPNAKMPFLAAIIVHRNYFKGKIPIIRLTLKDLTGEINSLIHHVLFEQYINDFTVGNVVVLRDFSVVNMSYGRSRCITITQNNLLTIYSLKEICSTQSSETCTQMPMQCERIDVQHFERSTFNNFVSNATLNTKCNIEEPSPSCSNTVSLDVVGPSMLMKSLPLLKKENIFESNEIFDDYDIDLPQFQAKKAKLDEGVRAKHNNLNAELDEDLHLFDGFVDEIPDKLPSILKKKPNSYEELSEKAKHKHLKAMSSADGDEKTNNFTSNLNKKDDLFEMLPQKSKHKDLKARSNAVLDANLNQFDEFPSTVDKIMNTKKFPDKEENTLFDNNRKADAKDDLKSKLKSFRFLAKVNTNEPTCDVSQIFEDAITGLDTDSFFSDF